MKPRDAEIRKSEFRNPNKHEDQNPKSKTGRSRPSVSVIRALSLWICFGFRDSNFEFGSRNTPRQLPADERSTTGGINNANGTEAVDRRTLNALTCELEDWFHILDSDKTPRLRRLGQAALCAERNVERLLHLFEETHVRATFFCLGWMAERMPQVVRKCQAAGHEIGSHGYAHIMARPTNRAIFRRTSCGPRESWRTSPGAKTSDYRSPRDCSVKTQHLVSLTSCRIGLPV